MGRLNVLLFQGALLMSCVCMCSVCGIAPQNNRIVGGVVAPDNNWPWQASVLSSSNRHFCGGFLVNDVWVLNSVPDIFIYLAVGRQRQFGSNPNQVIRNVDQIINHPEYNTDTSDNDIALLRLESAVPVNEISIVPICLAAPDSSIHTGVSTFVTGWGTLQEGGGSDLMLSPSQLVPIVGNRQCNCNYGVGRITDNMICAGEEGKDACQGDSGGPLVTKQGDRWVGIGVVSFGFGCARPDFPGVYARVSRYMSWINENIETNQPGYVTVTSTGTDSDLSPFSNVLLFPFLQINKFSRRSRPQWPAVETRPPRTTSVPPTSLWSR
uniref:Zgc:100868 n=1 Tax=Salarias fasciatus TaxID=181472 RepID=A0A672G861_SALFA